MSCHVMSCRVLYDYDVMLCHVVSCMTTMSCHVMSCRVLYDYDVLSVAISDVRSRYRDLI